MKVLHIGTKTWPPRHGGVEKIVHDLATAGGGVTAWVLADACQSGERVRPLAPGLLAAWRQARGLARREGIRVVHLHKETSVPLALLLKASGLRVVLTFHGFAWRLARWSRLQRAALWLLDVTACLCLDRLVFVGERDHREMRRLIPSSRLRLVRNGVAVPDGSGSSNGRGWVYLGRVSPEKNVNALIEAALAVGLELDLHGPLDERDAAFAARFRELAARPGIRWHGPLAFDQVPAMLARHGVLANVSFSEGLPVSVLEAAAQGLALVLSDIPQHRLLGFPGACYVDPCRLNLDGLLPDAAAAAANREHARRHFSLDAMVEAYHAIYRELA